MCIKCPNCQSGMEPGKIYGGLYTRRIVYWLPEDMLEAGTRSLWMLTAENIAAFHGQTLGTVKRLGLYAQNRPTTYYCRQCHTWLTKLESNN